MRDFPSARRAKGGRSVPSTLLCVVISKATSASARTFRTGLLLIAIHDVGPPALGWGLAAALVPQAKRGSELGGSVVVPLLWAVWALDGPNDLLSKPGVRNMCSLDAGLFCFDLGGYRAVLFIGCFLCGSGVDRILGIIVGHGPSSNPTCLLCACFVFRSACLARHQASGTTTARAEWGFFCKLATKHVTKRGLRRESVAESLPRS